VLRFVVDIASGRLAYAVGLVLNEPKQTTIPVGGVGGPPSGKLVQTQGGELHRELAFRLANDALKALKKAPRLDNWQDIERADKIARRAAGLESEDKTKVNVSLNLVNQRILAMQRSG